MSPKTDLIARLERCADTQKKALAADLRAAAAAVRLVGECREALGYAVDQLTRCNAMREREPLFAALASIADWEGKHGQ